jgi:hypothetical protein
VAALRSGEEMALAGGDVQADGGDRHIQVVAPHSPAQSTLGKRGVRNVDNPGGQALRKLIRRGRREWAAGQQQAQQDERESGELQALLVPVRRAQPGRHTSHCKMA